MQCAVSIDARARVSLSLPSNVKGRAPVSWHRAQVIAEKLRNLISVCSVELQAADAAWAEPAQAAG